MAITLHGDRTDNTDLLTSRPAFSASQDGDQTVTAETFTKVEFDTEAFDTDSKYDTSNYRFTPGVAGFYQFNLAIRGSSDTLAIVALYKNGSAFKRKVVGGHKYAALSIICESDADDYFEHMVIQQAQL